ncbi:MAG: DUF2971 domain-containing protein [Desulfoprunum sp.]
MNKNIYKYSSPDIIDKMFTDELVNLKCTFPKDYNDPYELFLSINPHGIDLKYIAYYQEILSDIPQLPTTCFSHSPIVVPMWAHYARDHSGFVIEVDEEKLAAAFPESTIQDIAYSAQTGTVDLEVVKYACITAKPRHTYRVIHMAFNNAYFTKNECWGYEKERRVVLNKGIVLGADNIMLMQIPSNIISSIILGPKANSTLINNANSISKNIGCKLYRMAVGRSSCIPYFFNKENKSYVFDGEKISPSERFCIDCKEPIYEASTINKCHWCSVDEVLQYYASSRNPLRMLHNIGMLEDYINMGK